MLLCHVRRMYVLFTVYDIAVAKYINYARSNINVCPVILACSWDKNDDGNHVLEKGEPFSLTLEDARSLERSHDAGANSIVTLLLRP